WQWHHLPLSMHEPAATAGARLVECAGETGGHATFWQAVAWLYSNTRGDGHGLPEGLRYPDLTPAMQGCLDSDRLDAVIRAQAVEAAQQGIAATPALQLRDRESGKTLLLHGPVEGDALLSAIDLLAAGSTTAAEPAHSPDMPAGVAGDMPR
ncbi:MAG: DsbA family protein, partial [Sphingomonadales bacterium]